MAVLPFTTALLSEYARGTEPERRLVALIYSGALAVSGLFFVTACSARPDIRRR